MSASPGDPTAPSGPPSVELGELRRQLDSLDRELVDVLARRLAVCRQVAAVKEHSDTPVIQPARVRDVLTSRRQMAIEAGVDPDFAEQVVRVLLTETHRIEVAGNRPDPAPDKAAAADGSRSALDTVASRIDHVVVAVADLDAAVGSLRSGYGFHVEPLADGDLPGVVALTAGGVTVVLVGPEASPAVAHYVADHGSGVQHLAIEVLNAGYARSSLAEGGAALLTDVVVDEPGHEQFFAARDTHSGLQFGFISRTGHRVGVGAANVLALFDALADESSPDDAAR